MKTVRPLILTLILALVANAAAAQDDATTAENTSDDAATTTAATSSAATDASNTPTADSNEPPVAAPNTIGQPDTAKSVTPGTYDVTAPSNSGITVKEVTEEQPKVEATVSPDGERKIEEVQEEIPALELDFDTGGEATLEFPTDVTTETDMEMGDDDTISVDFPDEEVRTIIRNVSDLYDLNVVIPDTLVGNTTIKLRNVTWRQVFSVVLEPLGYTYVEDRNIIKIKSIDELLQEPVDTRVFLINYALASQLETSLQPLIDAAAGGRVQTDQRTNALIITERPSRMNDIQEIIERLDQPTAQVQIHAMFIETQTNETLNLGVQWPTSSTFSITGSGPDNSVVLTGANAFTGVSFGNNAVLSMSSLSATVNFLENNTNSRLVNHPTVVTMDGEEAKIVVGEEIPIPNFTFNEETGRFQVSGFEYRDTGSVLTVTPNVNSAGFIRLQVKPELSERGNNGVTVATGSGASNATEIPSFDTKEAESTVVLKDGYTLAIGGLRKKETNTQIDKIPFLGDIPIIGELFTNTRKNGNENEAVDLIIFITARTLNPDGTTYKDMVDPRVLNRIRVTDSDIPDYQLPDAEQKRMDEVMRLRNDLDVANENTRLSSEASKLQNKLISDENDKPVKKKNTIRRGR